jgi:hypothetical protein
MAPLLARLEPYALDLWRHELTEWMPSRPWHSVSKNTYFGALYQRMVIKL